MIAVAGGPLSSRLMEDAASTSAGSADTVWLLGAGDDSHGEQAGTEIAKLPGQVCDLCGKAPSKERFKRGSGRRKGFL